MALINHHSYPVTRGEPGWGEPMATLLECGGGWVEPFSAEEVAATEQRLEVTFPVLLREWLTTLGGMAWSPRSWTSSPYATAGSSCRGSMPSSTSTSEVVTSPKGRQPLDPYLVRSAGDEL